MAGHANVMSCPLTHKLPGALGALGVAVLVAIGLPATAAAAFPGRDGLLVYGRFQQFENEVEDVIETRSNLELLNPRTGRSGRIRMCLMPDCGVDLPSWSPDGRRLVFRSITGGIFTARADGSGRSGNLAPPGIGAISSGWSPDGGRLLFDTFDVRARPSTNVYSVAVDGSGLRRLTVRGGIEASWSVRGEIAFERGFERGSRSAVYVLAYPGARRARRLVGMGGDPNWSPTGRSLVFTTSPHSRRANIAVIDRRGRGLRLLTRRGGEQPVWSPSGRRIAFVRGDAIYVIGRDGSRLRRLRHFADASIVIGLDWQAR